MLPGSEALGKAIPTLEDFELSARSRLVGFERDQISSRQGDSLWMTNAANQRGYESIKLRRRVLTGFAQRDLSVSVPGQRIALPSMLAPSGSHQRMHRDGEP